MALPGSLAAGAPRPCKIVQQSFHEALDRTARGRIAFAGRWDGVPIRASSFVRELAAESHHSFSVSRVLLVDELRLLCDLLDALRFQTRDNFGGYFRIGIRAACGGSELETAFLSDLVEVSRSDDALCRPVFANEDDVGSCGRALRQQRQAECRGCETCENSCQNEHSWVMVHRPSEDSLKRFRGFQRNFSFA